MTFRKRTARGKTLLQKGFPPGSPLSENSHSVAAQGGEMTHWDARTRQIGTFPVNHENISPAQNAGLPEGSGPLGLAPTCIVRLGAFKSFLQEFTRQLLQILTVLLS